MKRFFLRILNGENDTWVGSVIKIPFVFISIFYGLAIKLIQSGYRLGILNQGRLPVPVVSVGNLTVGGVGKTPMCIFLAKMLVSMRSRPVILTRGYKSGWRNDRQDKSDEVQLLQNSLEGIPIVVGSDRYQSGLQAIRDHQPDIILMDDGFQHWKLKRDLDIVLIDCSNPFGNGHLLPAGILRENISAVKRSGLVILTKSDMGNAADIRKQIELLFPNIPVADAVHRPVSITDVFSHQEHSLMKLKGAVVGFCGIGDPLSFKSLLVSIGADVKEFIPYMDHHEYQIDDMIKIQKCCERLGIKTIVTTEKDAVKLKLFKEFWQDYRVYSLKIQIDITKGIDEIRRKFHGLLLR